MLLTRHPVSTVDHPTVGLLFLLEVWSHHFLNRGLVTETCFRVRRKCRWKRRKREKKKRKRGKEHRISCLAQKCPEPLATLSFCLSLETSQGVWSIRPFLQLVVSDLPANGEDLWNPPGGPVCSETSPMATAGLFHPAWRIWLSQRQQGDPFLLRLIQWRKRCYLVGGFLGTTHLYDAAGAEVLFRFLMQGLENIIIDNKVMVFNKNKYAVINLESARSWHF